MKEFKERVQNYNTVVQFAERLINELPPICTLIILNVTSECGPSIAGSEQKMPFVSQDHEVI